MVVALFVEEQDLNELDVVVVAVELIEDRVVVAHVEVL